MHDKTWEGRCRAPFTKARTPFRYVHSASGLRKPCGSPGKTVWKGGQELGAMYLILYPFLPPAIGYICTVRPHNSGTRVQHGEPSSATTDAPSTLHVFRRAR